MRSGIYIAKRKEKIYLSNIKKEIIYVGSRDRGAKRFRNKEDAYEYLKKYNLEKDHRVILVK